MSKVAVRSGVVAGPLFVLSFLVQGAVRDGYDPLRHPVSSLALGEHGWVQSGTFLVAGALTAVFAVWLRRHLHAGPGRFWGPLFVGGWAFGLAGAGVFTTDPVSGYPLGSPPAYSSTQGALHDAVSLVAFVAILGACVVFARRFAAESRQGWMLYSIATAVVVLVALGLSNAAFAQSPTLVAFGGLFQRVMIVAAWCWLTLLAHGIRGSSGHGDGRTGDDADQHRG